MKAKHPNLLDYSGLLTEETRRSVEMSNSKSKGIGYGCVSLRKNVMFLSFHTAVAVKCALRELEDHSSPTLARRRTSGTPFERRARLVR